jgi:hypothetical protein
LKVNADQQQNFESETQTIQEVYVYYKNFGAFALHI